MQGQLQAKLDKLSLELSGERKRAEAAEAACHVLEEEIKKVFKKMKSPGRPFVFRGVFLSEEDFYL